MSSAKEELLEKIEIVLQDDFLLQLLQSFIDGLIEE